MKSMKTYWPGASPETTGANGRSAEEAQVMIAFAKLCAAALALGGQVKINDKYELSISPITRPAGARPMPAKTETPVRADAPEPEQPARIVPIDQAPTELVADQQARVAAALAAAELARAA